MRQVPLCCKTTAKDKQKQHITVYMMQEEQGHDFYVDILLVPIFQDKRFFWDCVISSRSFDPSTDLLFSSLTSAPELWLAWECYAITSLNMPTDTHFTLTSAVRRTKCGLENEWQPLKIINYASAKLLAHVHRAGLALRAGHTPPYGMCKNGHRSGVQRYTPEILTDIYFCPGHRRYATYVVKRCRTSRLHCLDDCCWEISAAF